MSGVLQGFLVIGVAIALGYVLGRRGVLGENATNVLSRAAFFVATPALLFHTLADAEPGEIFSWSLVIVGVTAALVCVLFVPAARWRGRDPMETTVGSMAAGYVNAGNLGLPIAIYALDGAAAVAPALIFQLALLTPVFTTVLDVQCARAEGRRPSYLWTVTAPARNPLAIATTLGVVVALTGVELPEAVTAPVEMIGDFAVPAMLFAFGISLVSAHRPGRDEDPVVLGAVVLLKNLVQPALALGFALLVGVDGDELLAVVVMAALPTAQNVFGYAVRYGAGTSLARDSALVSTVASIPVLLGVFGVAALM
ncbi:AEC family transporter [Actinomycetospora aeridis]|uniref:AEC family transporter n=1 Tax=Actinomycetospora aeridis TaxID=3129231 RepID=A0ABU8N3X6_9PSEU